MDHGLAVFTDPGAPAMALVHRANTRKVRTTICGQEWKVVATLKGVDAAAHACALCWHFPAVTENEQE